MDNARYERLALKTAASLTNRQDKMMNAALGLAGESGEIADMLKKAIYQGHELDTNKLELELGDLLWYINLMCSAIDTNISTVMDRNIEKLAKRYPDGVFSTERSINRES